MTVSKTVRNALLAIAFGVLALFGAAHASADPSDMDAQFIALMQRDGIGSHAGYTGLISVGHGVCVSRMQGWSEDSVISYIYANTRSDFTRADSAAIVRDAEQVYCPGFYEGGSTV